MVDKDEIGRILAEARLKRRNYADFFHWTEKNLKEWGIVQAFFEEIERQNPSFFLQKSGNQHPGGENFAPDYSIKTTDGALWGIEITELVSQEAIEATKRGYYVEAEWPDDELVRHIYNLVSRKDSSENVRGGPYDCYVLLVHADESMITADRLQVLLGDAEFKTKLIDDIYIMISYDPKIHGMPITHFRANKSR